MLYVFLMVKLFISCAIVFNCDVIITIKDYEDTSSLISYNNVDRERLTSYVKEAADFSTKKQLPQLDFAVNQYGQEDVSLFDFTCMYVHNIR